MIINILLGIILFLFAMQDLLYHNAIMMLTKISPEIISPPRVILLPREKLLREGRPILSYREKKGRRPLKHGNSTKLRDLDPELWNEGCFRKIQLANQPVGLSPQQFNLLPVSFRKDYIIHRDNYYFVPLNAPPIVSSVPKVYVVDLKDGYPCLFKKRVQ